MSLTINLTPQDEAQLEAAARRKGLAPEQLAADLLRYQLRISAGPDSAAGLGAVEAETLADLLGDEIGIFEGAGEPSQNAGEQFTDYLERKQREGHL